MRSQRFGCLLALVVASALGGPAPAEDDGPRREDRGDLIVLHLHGSWAEMGRQEAALMGPELRAVYELQRGEFQRGLARRGRGARLLDALLFPAWSAIGPAYEESGLHDELGGIAEGLGVPGAEVMRALFSLSGSTVFVATRSATADGQALIGRNVDWPDAGGRRRPVVLHYRPTNGDLAYVATGWPLVGLPTVGMNEAGLALSFNFFESQPQVGLLLPQWPHRRALQRARTVAEGIRVFQQTRLLGISTFMVMADASGEIAMLECIPSRCSVFRPDGDWFAQANHARTAEMIPHDRYRSPDSFERLAGMEAAVRPHLGSLTPERAAAILRDRSAGPFPNASHVGNLEVLNAVVVHPASRTLWHSTTRQPYAPYGAYAAFSPSRDVSSVPELPAAPAVASAGRAAEADAVAAARRGLERFLAGDFAGAGTIWDALAAAEPPLLDPVRIAFGRALARWRLGELERAYEVLAAAEDGLASSDAALHGVVARARLADRLGRREDALRLYRLARTRLGEHPEFNTFDALRAAVDAGLRAPSRDGSVPELGSVLRLPQ